MQKYFFSAPIIYIADSALENRNVCYYDLRVVLSEVDKSYKLGESIEIKGQWEEAANQCRW